MVNCDNPLLTQQQQSVLCVNPNLIAGFAGGIPVANGASFAPDLLPAGFGPLTFFDARGNQYNQAYFNLLRRNVEGGPRISDLTHTNFRGVVGTRGDLSKVWSYDTYFQYGRTNYSQVYKNEFSARRLVNALNVAAVDANGQVVAPTGFDANGFPIFPAGTQIVCRSVLDNTDPNCVPLDVFSGNGLTPAMINYLNVFGVIEGRTNEQVANLNFTGALGEMGIQTPWSDEGVGINVGTEYRKESLSLNPDQSFQTGDLTGQGAPTLPVSGNFRVLELFGEVQVPIIKNSFIDELSINAGYRKSWYQTHPGPELRDNAGNPLPNNKFSTDTYKISAEFAPVKDIRFRGAYNRAVRAPNIQELFAPTFVGLDASADPCATGQPDVGTLGCLVQGVPAGGTPGNPAEQYNGLIGGNPDLQPEKATTKTLGAVIQPRFIPRLAITVDWYDIKVDNAIQPFGADAILTNCTNQTNATGTAAPSCALIHRAPGGSIWLSPNGYVIDIPHNVGGVQTRGIDGSVAYSTRLGGIGNLSASFIGTWLDKYLVNDGLNPEYDCSGLYGAVCGNPLPTWRHKARATLQMRDGIGVSLQWRRVGKVKSERLSTSDVLTGPVPGQLSHVKAQDYFDLATTFDLGDHYQFRMGVNNILDKTPPLFTSSRGACSVVFCNGNTYVGTYDALGRYIYAGATLNF
jgi:outer membrane receptor protein involved in Fe transport